MNLVPSNIFSLSSLLSVSAILWLFGIALGISYMILPGYIFAIALVLCLIFVVGFLRPEYAFYLFIFVLIEEMVHFFIVIPPLYEVRIYPYQLPLFATALGLIAAKISSREDSRKTPVTALLWVVVISEMVSGIWAPSGEMAFWLSIILLSNLILYYVTVNVVVNEDILRKSVRVWIAAGVATSIGITLSQWIDESKTIFFTNHSGIKLAFQELLSRPAGLAGVDHAAGFVSTALFMALGSMTFEKGWKVKAFYLLIILFMLYGAVLTTSRGVIIGIVGAYLFFIYIHGLFKGKFIRYSVLFTVLTILVVLMAKPGFIDRMLIGFGYTGALIFSDNSYNGTEASTETGEGFSGMEIRKIWWENALQEMIRHPFKLLFGLGTGGFYYYSAGGNTVTSPEVNSISFAFFYEMGIWGVFLLILLAYLVVSNLYHYLKNAKKSYASAMLFAATTAMIAETGIHGLIDYDLSSYGSKFFWFPLGFAMAILNIVKDENAQPVEQIHEMEEDITAA